MDQNRDFATDSPVAFERERLGFLRDLADPMTIRRLTRLGIGCGWHCLEVAASFVDMTLFGAWGRRCD
jgi:hypothetical protein